LAFLFLLILCVAGCDAIQGSGGASQGGGVASQGGDTTVQTKRVEQRAPAKPSYYCNWEDEIRSSMRSGGKTPAYACLLASGLPRCSDGRWRQAGFGSEHECSDKVMTTATERCGHLCQ
jgi:hypothetical protein